MVYLSLEVNLKRLILTSTIFISVIFTCIASEPISPIFKTDNLDIEKFELGQMLFEDKRLSGTQQTSCQSCHDIATGGDDGLKTSANLSSNSPTILNVGKNYYVGWQGKFNQLKPHLEMILDNPKVMGTDWDYVLRAFNDDFVYSEKFQSVYKNAISRDNIIDAIVYYEDNLIAPSKFDEFLLGNTDAISSSAKQGYKKFKDYGCVSCHQGANLGGNIFQKLGIALPFKGADGKYKTKKLRVPSLRNVERTAPYLHNGSVDSLRDVIKAMAKYQLGETLTDTEVEQIYAFLKSLNSISPYVSYETD